MNRILALIFLIILGVAFFLRFHELSTLPFGIYSDEAYYANDALLSLKNKEFKVFYEDNNGREGLFIWIIAFFQSFVDPSVFSLRLVPAIIGTLTVALVPFMYSSVVSEENSDDNQKKLIWIGALSAMFFLACSYWHMNFSRIAFRAILDPLSATATIWLTSIALHRSSNRPMAVIAGIISGLGLYGYGSQKFIVFPLAVLVLSSLWNDKRKYKQVLLIVLFAILTMLPLVLYICKNPAAYFERMSQVSVFSKENPFQEFMRSLGKVTEMLFGQGDLNSRHNINGEPQLNPIVFVFFAFGLLMLIARLFSGRNSDGKDAGTSFLLSKNTSVLFLCWFFCMILPSAITSESQPHALRAIGMIIPVMCIAGIGVAHAVQRLNIISISKNNKAIIILSGFTAFIIFYHTYTAYFERMLRNPVYRYYFGGDMYEEVLPVIQDKAKQKIIILDESKTLATENRLQPILFLMDYDLPANNTKVLRYSQRNEQPMPENSIIFASSDTIVSVPASSRLVWYR